VQGGLNAGLRQRCVEEMLKRAERVPGFAIGGLSGGESKASKSVLWWCLFIAHFVAHMLFLVLCRGGSACSCSLHDVLLYFSTLFPCLFYSGRVRVVDVNCIV
jgi:hypothetical protein